MDHEILVKEFRKIAAHLKKSVGGVELVVLTAPEENARRDWTLVVSARGYDSWTRFEALQDLAKTLRARLSEEVWRAAHGVDVLKTDDPFVQTFKRRYYYLKTGAEVPPTTIAGTEIGKAVIIEIGAKTKKAA